MCEARGGLWWAWSQIQLQDVPIKPPGGIWGRRLQPRACDFWWNHDQGAWKVSLWVLSHLRNPAQQQKPDSKLLWKGKVLPASLSRSLNLENSIHHLLSPQDFVIFCYKSPWVEVGSDFTQALACSGVKFEVTRGYVFLRTSVLPSSQQEWNCLTMPSPWGPLWKWDVSLMRTSQQAQLKYLCDCSSSVMNELIDFTLSCFFIDPAGPTVGKELCSSSSFPQSPVLFKGRRKGFRAQNGNPKTSILDGSQMGHQAAHWVWIEGWELHLSATLRGSVTGGKWVWEVWCPDSASTSVCDCLHCSGHLCGLTGSLGSLSSSLPS